MLKKLALQEENEMKTDLVTDKKKTI